MQVVLAASDAQVTRILRALAERALTRVRVSDTIGLLALEPRVLFVSTGQQTSAYVSLRQNTMRPEAASVCGLKLLVYVA
jgi:hypothetical protein